MLTEKITLIVYLTILWSKCLSQITSTQCFSDRLQRCQHDINNIINSVPVNAPVPEITHHHPNSHDYSGNQAMNEMQSKCSAVRGDFDCLLTYTAGCLNSPNIQAPYGGSSSHSQSSHSNEIYRAKQFLDKYCDHGPSGGWRGTQCYQRGDIRNCESSLTSLASGQPCANFNTFKTCALNYVRTNCPASELSHFSSYLFDKASDQAWQCSPGENYLYPYGSPGFNSRITNAQTAYVPGSSPDRYGTYGSSGSYGQGGYNQQYPGYGQNNYGNTYGSQGSVGIGQTGYPSLTGSYNHQHGSSSYGSRPPYGSSYDSHSGSGIITDGNYALGQPDRFGPGQTDRYGPGMGMTGMTGVGGDPSRNYNLFPAENCVERSVYYARSCEDMLLQRQREARNGRTGIDVSRRLCCSLYFYHDCLSKVVIQYCRDASPTTVELMMGQRKREMAITCRDFSREQCNSSMDLNASRLIAIITSITVLFALRL